VPNKLNIPKKYTYITAFLLGILGMLLVYVIFDFTNPGEYGATVQGNVSVNVQQDSVQVDVDGIGTPIVSVSNTTEEVPVPTVFLGVEIMAVDAVIAEQLNVSGENGVLINSIIANSPAQRAGLKRGDVIISLDKNAVKDVDGFKAIMAGLNPDDSVRIVYIRDGKRDSTYAELIALSLIQKTAGTGDADDEDSEWGVSLGAVTPLLRDSFDIPIDIEGIMVLAVEPGGVADEAGLKPGDVITGVDRTEVMDLDDFFSAVLTDKNNMALLDVYSQGANRYIPIDSTSIKVVADQDQTQARDQASLRQKIFSIFTGGTPFADDDEEDEEGPKGGKFADDNVTLTADNAAFNRPSSVPGDINTGGTSGDSSGTTSITGMNRPSEVPPQTSGSDNDTVLFIGLLLLLILYLAYREYHRPSD